MVCANHLLAMLQRDICLNEMKSPLTCDYSGNVLRGLARREAFFSVFITGHMFYIYIDIYSFRETKPVSKTLVIRARPHWKRLSGVLHNNSVFNVFFMCM